MRRVYTVEIEVKESGTWDHWSDMNVIASDAVRAGTIAVNRYRRKHSEYPVRAKNINLVVTL